MERPETLEAYNDEILYQWIAKCLGVKYSNLMKETFTIDADTGYNQILITFILSTPVTFLSRGCGFKGNYTFTLINNIDK